MTPAAMHLADLAAELTTVLRLKSSPVAMQRFPTVQALQQIPKLRRPSAKQTTDQIVAQAARLGWTVGIVADDLVGDQCRAVIGLSPRDEAWSSGKPMVGVWYATDADARAHQSAMATAPHGGHEALVVSPLANGRLAEPDIVMFYATPGAMMYFINGFQWRDYRAFNWSIVGESSCADSWGRALATRQPSLSIPCFAERRFGGVQDEELLMALTVDDLAKGLDGMKVLAGNGIRYPFVPFGIEQDPTASMSRSYRL